MGTHLVCYTAPMGLFLPTPVEDSIVTSHVERKLRWILSACSPAEVWLFGSAASGTMTEASDIDLALIFRTGGEIRDAQATLARTPRLVNWRQDLVWYLAEDFYDRARVGGLPMIIMEDGIQLYPKGAA